MELFQVLLFYGCYQALFSISFFATTIFLHHHLFSNCYSTSQLQSKTNPKMRKRQRKKNTPNFAWSRNSTEAYSMIPKDIHTNFKLQFCKDKKNWANLINDSNSTLSLIWPLCLNSFAGKNPRTFPVVELLFSRTKWPIYIGIHYLGFLI